MKLGLGDKETEIQAAQDRIDTLQRQAREKDGGGNGLHSGCCSVQW